MVTIAKFFKSEDAHLFRSFLESEGIAAHVFDEHISQWFWQNTLAFGGVRVVVADEDFEQAEQLYVEYNESMKTAPFVEPPVREWPVVALLSLIAGFPMMLLGRKTTAGDNPAEMRGSEMTALTLRVLMGAWFVYAGGLKIFGSGLERFVTDIENYRLALGGLAVAGNVAIAVAYVVPWLEVVAGICFMLGILRKGSWLVMFGLVMAFTVAVASAWWRGLDISCGCLGGSEKISYWQKAVEFGVYLIALGWIAWVEWRSQPRMNANERESRNL